jgi:hypothetical protein
LSKEAKAISFSKTKKIATNMPVVRYFRYSGFQPFKSFQSFNRGANFAVGMQGFYVADLGARLGGSTFKVQSPTLRSGQRLTARFKVQQR